MSVHPPPLPPVGNSNEIKNKRRTVTVLTGAFGLIAGGLFGYGASSAWANWATTNDPEWPGGMAMLVIYVIIAAATVVAAMVGVAVSVTILYLFRRSRRGKVDG